MTLERWEKIEQVFHSAAERTGEEREAYLENACAGDMELRREVESLLAHGKTADGWLGGEALKQMAEEVLDGSSGLSLSGQQLGPYQVLAAIGAGGMGEVYRARDTRLNRFVAIKVLPKRMVQRTELRERLEREARTIASLNHAHICALYDVGHQDGVDYLVLEYLEGETLAERLKKGPLPLVQVLEYAVEISDALDKAHRKGITHRDLKPGNIMLTKSGTKLLDFGLAKIRQEASPAVSLSQRPTAESDMTAEGTILGTLQYMAPEQVEGKTNDVDGRTDIFAFGAVVYEMATGKKAFEGKSQASLIAKILETDPAPISALQPMTPPALDRVVKKCMAKEPERRWQAASDIRDELKWIAEGASQTGSPATATKGARSFPRRALLWGLASLLLAVIVGLAVWNLRPASAPLPVTRTVFTLPTGDRLVGPDLQALALSPDGKNLAYAAIHGGAKQIYLRAMDNEEARPIPDTEGGYGPFFSPDGQWLGFFAAGKLKKVSVSGGAALTLAEGIGGGNGAYGGTWSSKGLIVFPPFGVGGLTRISDAGGPSESLTSLEKGELTHRFPAFLPDGRAVLFGAGATSVSSARIAVDSIATGERRVLIPSGSSPSYASSGHLIYSLAGTLMAVPFDAQQLQLKGSPVPVVQGVSESQITGATQYAISNTGTLAYVAGNQEIQRRMVWVSRSGTEQPLPAPPRAYQYVRVSPDGRRVAVELDNQIWLYDLARDTLMRFTFQGSVNQSPVWTPDGKRIAFYSNQEGDNFNLFWQRADGSGGLERLTNSEYGHIPKSFSPDGQFLAYHENNNKTQKDIWVLSLKDHKAQPFLVTPFIEGAPTFSPDGHWLAYVSNESGRPEVYVQPYPGPGGKWQISTDGGTEPAWNPNGRELFYRSGSKMMALDVSTKPSFSAGKPHMLFEGAYFTSDFPLVGTAYDVSPDGQKFLVAKDTEQTTAVTQIEVVLNWFEELKRQVPSGAK